MGRSLSAPDVLAVVVAHASRTRLRETLRSLRAQTFGRGRDAAGHIEVVVAAIGELEVPQDRDLARARVVRVDEPAGFADVVQAALDHVPGAEFVLLLHDDVSLEPGAIAELVQLASTDADIAAVGAKLVEWDRPEVLQEVGASIDRYAIRRSALDAGEVDAGQRDDTSDVLFCSDACLLVRRSALEEVGGLDGGAWPFYEDVDLCWRLRARGHRVLVAPQARVRHAADLSRGRRLFDTTTMREHLERGRLRFMLKHYAPIGLVVLLPQILIASLVRVGAAIARRELWRIRVIFNSWTLVAGELPSLLAARRRAGPARVDDRELLALAGRSAVADVRGERAEWASSILAYLGRLGDRLLSLARQPVAWGWTAAGLVLVLMLRNVLFSGTFALGELRLPPTLSDAVADHLGRVRSEGLDPFGPGSPGLLFVAVVRSVVRSGALAEKLLLLLPLWLAGTSGRRLGRTLGLRGDGPGWLSIVAAVNPVTLSLIRDGALGALVLWSALLWLAAGLLAPAPVGEGFPAVVRFAARWGLGWAVVVALHPPALLWLVVLGAVVVAACRDDNRTDDRVRILTTGAIGSFVLLLPWSLEWITRRTPLIGRPGWLVDDGAAGFGHASLGGGWPLLGLVLLAIAASFFVGQTRTTLALVLLASISVFASATGLFARETLLTVAGVSSMLVIAVVVRRIADDLTSYELGGRHAAVIGGLVAMGVLWLGGVVINVGPGTRARTLPAIATQREQTGRVLWLTETTGGVRSWETLGFAERLGALPPPGGPAERLVTRGLEAAREERTHRLGGILALADISHVVALDAPSRRGLDAQADIAQQESQGGAVVYHNEAWRGPAMLLAAPPADPLSPQGLADVVRDPRRVPVKGWPDGPITVDPPRARERPDGQVLYLASGVRGGVDIQAGGGKLSAAGSYISAEGLAEPFGVGPPGGWWRWLVPLGLIALLLLLGAWFAAAYVGGPPMPSAELLPDLKAIAPLRWAFVAVPALVVFGAGVGWFGTAWGIGGPFLSSAWYCPPVGTGYTQTLGIVNPQGDDVEYIVRPDLIGRPEAEGRIPAMSRTTLQIRATDGAVVESYGRRLAVAAQVERLGDRDASLCTRAARELNVFPEGGRFATRAQPRLFERYVLYNPFPDLARASVKFYTPERPIAPPKLQDVQVKPGQYTLIDPEAQDQPYTNLSTVVTVWQGRAIVARRLRTVEQISWSLPVSVLQAGGVLSRAQTDKADTAVIAVNTAEEPARVAVFGSARRGSIPEETFTVPAGGRNTFELDDVAPRAAELVVELETDRPVALESLVAPDDRRRGVSLLSPVVPERSWVFPIAERRELVVVNPNPKAIRVDVDRMGPGPPVASFVIEASRTARIKLQGSRGFGLIVRSRDGAFTAAVVGGRGSMNGVPFS